MAMATRTMGTGTTESAAPASVNRAAMEVLLRATNRVSRRVNIVRQKDLHRLNKEALSNLEAADSRSTALITRLIPSIPCMAKCLTILVVDNF